MNDNNTYNIERVTLDDFTYNETTPDESTSVSTSSGHFNRAYPETPHSTITPGGQADEIENSFHGSPEKAKNYFSNRIDLVRSIIKEFNLTLIFPGQDGRVLGSWLLTEIGLWDNEMERLITLTDKELIIIKYDFIALKQLNFCKVSLQDLDTVCVGDLVYPARSLMANRNSRGIRVTWNNGLPVSVLKTWNPFSKDIPIKVFTSHPLFKHKDTSDGNIKNLYDFEHFTLALCTAIKDLYEGRDMTCQLLQAPVLTENYAGLTSWIYNKTDLGYSKVRGKFSF